MDISLRTALVLTNSASTHCTCSLQHRVDFQAQGGGNNRRNFNVGGGVRGEYDVYRGKGGSRVVVSGGVADGLSRVDGKTYHGKPQTNVGIKVEVPFKG
ncbi:hypothetical protein HPB48_007037 [Haemaphysalis longicornis]|uniref:Uncharacterized protein n=1 Tax=Haemaphysalis longicornis TaxID=44386 RepID=A0A9J6FFX8_HAELO|nr:hypothetical protein HPB48_007037 [Haemaphysalis longicornis]